MQNAIIVTTSMKHGNVKIKLSLFIMHIDFKNMVLYYMSVCLSLCVCNVWAYTLASLASNTCFQMQCVHYPFIHYRFFIRFIWDFRYTMVCLFNLLICRTSSNWYDRSDYHCSLGFFNKYFHIWSIIVCTLLQVDLNLKNLFLLYSWSQ